ncbi:MAG: cysteine peptidase family C39 domain-containing protein [Bacteroidota bacterium]
MSLIEGILYAFGVLLFIFIVWKFWPTNRPDHFPMVFERSGGECGPASLAMVLKHFGYNVSLDALVELTNAHPYEGTSLRFLKDAAQQKGLRALPIRVPFERKNKPSLMDVPLPCILHWQEHYFLVLYKIRGKKFYVAHPGSGKLVFKKEDFKNNWLPKNRDEGIALVFEKRRNKFA